MSIFKNFKFAERYTLQFNWAVFNVLNRTMFQYETGNVKTCDIDPVTSHAVPGTCGSSFGAFFATPDVGSGLNPILGTGAQRNMQFGLKFIF